MEKTSAHRKLGLVEIDPASVAQWRDWGAHLMGQAQNEALATLREEGLAQEHVFLIELDQKYYLGFFTEGEHLPANLTRELNQKHAELLDASRVRKIEGEQLYSLKLPHHPESDEPKVVVKG